MEILEIGYRLLLAFALGAAIGLEREINEKKTSIHNKVPTATLGIRSFSLMTGLGATAGFIFVKSLPLAILLAAGFFFLMLLFYFLDSKSTNDYGLTTELSALYSFVIGLLLATNILPLQITIALATVVILLLSQKDRIKDVVSDIRRTELNTFIVFAILALVIMPFLPNTGYSLSDFRGINEFFNNIGISVKGLTELELVNPFKTWLILVLITGVDLVSHILGRVVGERKGWFVASAVGGLVSSTATTQSLAQQSLSSQKQNHLVAAAVLANLTSFFQIFVLIGLVNGLFLIRLIPVIAVLVITSSAIFFLLLRIKEKSKNNTRSRTVSKEEHIINLSAALKFVGLYLLISVISRIALALFGNTGFLAATGFGAMIGLDAVMINTSQLAGGRIDYGVATLAFILANGVNLTAKSFYSFLLGKKEFAIKFSISMAVIIAASLISYFIF